MSGGPGRFAAMGAKPEKPRNFKQSFRRLSDRLLRDPVFVWLIAGLLVEYSKEVIWTSTPIGFPPLSVCGPKLSL